MCVGECAVCVGVARAPGGRPPLRGRAEDRDRGRPAGELNERAGLGFGRLSLGRRAGGAGGAGWLEDWLVVGRARLLARSAGRSGPEDFVGLTGLTAPALLGWGLRVIVCAWSVSVFVGPR